MTRDGTAESVSRDQILRHEWGQGRINFPCSTDQEQDWQTYPVDPYHLAICDVMTIIKQGSDNILFHRLQRQNLYMAFRRVPR